MTEQVFDRIQFGRIYSRHLRLRQIHLKMFLQDATHRGFLSFMECKVTLSEVSWVTICKCQSLRS